MLIISWFIIQETEPTPNSAAIQRTVTRCDWHRSSCTSRHLSGRNSEITVRPSVNHVIHSMMLVRSMMPLREGRYRQVRGWHRQRGTRWQDGTE